MEVLKSNMREMREEINKAINNSLFIAIDAEFTGLDAKWDTEQRINIFNTPSEYYHKVLEGAMDFLMVQLGLCIFSYNSDKQKFQHCAFNIQIFPSQGNFMCHCSTLRFLDAHGFDFTRMIREGLPVLTAAQAEKKELRRANKAPTESSDINGGSGGTGAPEARIPIPPEHKSLVEEVLKDIGRMKNEELELRPLNAFIRKLIYQEAGRKYPDIVLESRPIANSYRRLFARKRGSPEEEKRRQGAKELEDELKYQDSLWLVNLMKTLSTSGKLIVGHNMFLDLCHVLKYLWPSLPDNYADFKDLCHTAFPRVLDTKSMASFVPFKENIKLTVLNDILQRLKQPPYEIPQCNPESPKTGFQGDENREHEAAYDAYLTGLCFLGMAKHLDSLENPEKFLYKSDTLEPYLNKINLNRLIDSPYMNLSGKDLAAGPRDHIFHCTFPLEWKVQNLRDIFKAYGNIDIAWLTDTTALVGIRDRKLVPRARKAFSLKRKLEYTIRPWNPDETDGVNLKNLSPIQRRRSHSFGKLSEGRPSFPEIPEENEDELEEENDNKETSKNTKEENKDDLSSPKQKRAKKDFEENDEWN